MSTNRILVAAVLLSTLIFGAVNAQNQCIMEDFVITNIQKSSESDKVGSACPVRDQAYALKTNGGGIAVGSAANRLSVPYCIGILADIADNEGSVMHFFDYNSRQRIGGITLTQSEISITVRDKRVTFPIDATDEKYFQLCSDGSNLQLYKDCSLLPETQPFQDLSLEPTDFLSLYRDVYNATDTPFRRSVTQLYFLSCTGPGVVTEDVADLLCQANPPDCIENATNIWSVIDNYVEQLNAATPPPSQPPTFSLEDPKDDPGVLDDPQGSGCSPEVSDVPRMKEGPGCPPELSAMPTKNPETYILPKLDEDEE